MKWKRFIGSQSAYPPPSKDIQVENRVESNFIVNNINIVENESESDNLSTHSSMADLIADSSEEEDSDIAIDQNNSLIPTDSNHQASDIVLCTGKGKSSSTDTSGDVNQPAYVKRLPQHIPDEKEFGDGDSSESGEEANEVSDDDISGLLNVLEEEKIIDR